jgi:asparagine synthase (glutamine-hydrolysing)
MCGICGIYNFNNTPVVEKNIIQINDTLRHRGPDSGSVKVFNNVALGHRRLSIIDLSDQANQPMITKDERYTIVYNGEVYNFKEIKEKLIKKGVVFYTESDTEVILQSFIEYGVECFKIFNGMFSLAIYDKLSEELFLCRDPFGIKPLYYFKDKNTFVFASEMKAIKKAIEKGLSINNQALVEYLWYGNPLGENTIYKEIKEVKPGAFLKISTKEIEEHTYFNINHIKENSLTENEIVTKITVLLENAVKRHLISDVPVGVFLSGGIDSSAITAFASKHYKGKLKTYSVGFDYNVGINELPLAKNIAKKYNTEHHEVQVSGQDIINVIEDLVEAHDEPFGDAADIPLFLLTKKLKGKVKVVLQGDGGDEFFGGYSRYNTMTNAKKWSLFSFLSPIIKFLNIKNVKLLRLQRFLEAISQKESYKRNALLLTMESKYSRPLRVLNEEYYNKVRNLDPFKKYKEVYEKYPKDINPTQAMFFTDAQIILKDTFFEKVDKSVMANSMEVRVPFIDKELTNFMLSVNGKLKTKNANPKYLLKKALNNIVPAEVLYGKKMGFGVPYAHWLKTSLKEYFIEQITTEKVEKYINIKEVSKMFDMHKKGKGNFGFLLWKVLIFAVWVNKQGI